MVRALRGILLLCISGLTIADAQEQLHQIQVSPPESLAVSSLSFERVLSTYVWQNQLLFTRSFDQFQVDYHQNLRSRLVRTTDRALQDEVAASLSVEAALSDSWKGVVLAGTSILSDNRALDLGRLSDHQALAGFERMIGPDIRVRALGGYALGTQLQTLDKGFSYLVDARGADLAWGDFDGSFDLSSERSYFARRTPQTDSLRVALASRLGQGGWNRISVSLTHQSREFYALADTILQRQLNVGQNVFRRNEQDIEVADSLIYVPGSTAEFLFIGSVSSRGIERGFRYKSFSPGSSTPLDTRIQELHFAGGVAATIRPWSWMLASASLRYEEREEQHNALDDPAASDAYFDQQERIARRLGNVARRTSMTGFVVSSLGTRDSLRLGGSASILRYDTPDSLNTDDRDEALFVVSVEESHRFSELLSTWVGLEVTLGHLVYLDRSQSANNAWNRILRLRTRIDYEPAAWIHNVAVAEVLANYTAYDYDEQVQSVRSYSFRQALWGDSAAVRLSRRISFAFSGQVRIYERGLLRWREFKERPENYFVELSFWPRFQTAVAPGIWIGVGYRHFSQDRYRYDSAERIFERRFQSAGPTVALQWEGEGPYRLALEGWREVQRDGTGITRSISNVSLIVGALL